MFYILDADGNPKHTEDIDEWSRWRASQGEHSEGRVQVARTEFVGGAMLSTVFLGYDSGFRETMQGHDPILWETMLFCDGHKDNQEPRRYTSRERAERKHEELVRFYCDRDGFILTTDSERERQAKQPVQNRTHKPRIRRR